jgi:integrase
LKTTKTTESTRDVELPQFVIDALPKKGKLVTIDPARVSDRFIKTLKKLNNRNFRFHDLRHYSASVMHAIGVPDVYIMERGGWKSDATLKKIYRGKMDDYQKKFTDVTNSHFENICHEI